MTQFYGQLGQSYGHLQWIQEQFEIIVIYGGLESLSCKFVTKLLTQTGVLHFCIFMGIMHDTEEGGTSFNYSQDDRQYVYRKSSFWIYFLMRKFNKITVIYYRIAI